MILLGDMLFERSSRGILYHYTSLNSCYDILNTNTLRSAKVFNERKFKFPGEDTPQIQMQVISFTRDSRFHEIRRSISGMDCRLVLDGDSLSDKYKIRPTQEQYYERGANTIAPTESEERIIAPMRKTIKIDNISKYIIRIDFLQDDMSNFNSKEAKLFDKLNELGITYNFIGKRKTRTARV